MNAFAPGSGEAGLHTVSADVRPSSTRSRSQPQGTFTCGCERERAEFPFRATPSGLHISWIAAALVVAATYFYFLIFAEFALLELAGNVAPGAGRLRLIMLGLGAGGIGGAIIAAWPLRALPTPTLLTWSLRGCALSAALTLGANVLVMLAAAGFAVGLSLGALTVAVAGSLRAATAGRRLGLCIGAGTGLAYALCNVPAIFHATPATQTLLAAFVTGAASFLPRLLWVKPAPADLAPTIEMPAGGAARWIVILLALVWMDSAAFYIVQHTPALRATTWGTTNTLYANAAIHFGMAVVAGALLDRGWRRTVVGVAVLALAAACLGLNGTMPVTLPAGWFYTAGVSLYSTVLVEFPARTGRRSIAAAVFTIAGWGGSAFGIGMAQDLARVPLGFIAIAVATVAAALVWRPRRMAFLGIIALFPFAENLRADDVLRGREVYIAEGCIHCHSQYIRPLSAVDVELWGPAAPLRDALAAAPPLFGTRRQGPDLSHVGNRRSAEWNRLHLIDPQAISPGSRMPAYAHLFKGGDSPGEALVAYLASLGADSVEQRRRQIAAWSPDSRVVISADRAGQLFSRLCVQCHGTEGRGDGFLAEKLSVRPPDWTRSDWRHVPADASRDGIPPRTPAATKPLPKLEIALSRIIKFGLPGLPMAGHEYLPDAEIVGLAQFVRTLHTAGGPRSPVAVQP